MLDKLKGVSIGAAVTSLIVGVIYSIARLLTDDAVKWGCIGLTLFLLALFLSWGFTEVYKRGYILSFKGLPELEIRAELFRIYMCSVVVGAVCFAIEGLIPLCISGVVLKLDHDLAAWVNLTGWTILWLFIALLVGVSSPILWWATFKVMIPYFEKKELGIDTESVTRVDRDPNTGEPYAIKQGSNKTEFLGVPPKQ